MGFSWLTGYLNVDYVILAGSSFAAFVLLVLFATQVNPEVAAVAGPWLKRTDIFAKFYMGTNFLGVLNVRQRRVGGAFTLLGGISFVSLALVNILQRAADNVSTQESVVALTDSRYALARALPVFSASPWGSGIQVRITASGDGTECARPVSWAPANAGWQMTSTAACAGTSSQLVFSCSDCVSLESSMVLDVAMHYSCQSLLVEVGAIDGLGAVTAFSLPASKTVASAGALLSSITWTLPTLLSIVNSTVAQSSSARGYTITSGPHVITQQALAAAPGGGLAITPNTASIALKIAFPLNSFYSITTLTEKQSVAALLSSLIGLAGIFGLFGSLLSATDFLASCSRRYAVCANCKRGHAFAAASTKLSHDGQDPLESTANPLADGRMAKTTQNHASERWTQHSDETGDTWFVSTSGETVWELPAGAVLAGP